MKNICRFCLLIIFCLGMNSCVVYDTTPNNTTIRYYYGYYYGRPNKTKPYYKPHHHHRHHDVHRHKRLKSINVKNDKKWR